MRHSLSSKVKRFCAFALTLTLVGTSFPAVNFAEEPGEEAAIETFAEEESEEEYLPSVLEDEEPETEAQEAAEEAFETAEQEPEEADAEEIPEAEEQETEIISAEAEEPVQAEEAEEIADEPEESIPEELETAEQELQADIVNTYTVSSTITATLDSDGVLTVSGTGAMPSYNSSGKNVSPWNGNGSIKKAVISEGITTVGRFTFYSCYSLTSVTVVSGKTIISQNALYGCNVTSLIHGSITYTLDSDGVLTVSGTGEMPHYAEQNNNPIGSASTVTKIVISDGITAIGNNTFNSFWYSRFSNVVSVEIASSVTTIGSEAFRFCRKLASVNIPSSVTKIGSAAFYDCGFTTATVPSTVTNLEPYAFGGAESKLKDLTVNASVDVIPNALASYNGSLQKADLSGSTAKTIGEKCFEGCRKLTEVILPKNLERIEAKAFIESRNLSQPDWPSSLTFISGNAFPADFPDDWYPEWLERNYVGDFVPRGIPFTDVPEDHPYYKEIREMYDRGLMTGTTPTTFEPDTTLNRAFLTAVLYRRAGTPAQTYDGRFPDVAAGDWFMPSVMWASVTETLVGYSDGTFGPTDLLTREQLCTVLWRIAVTMDGCWNFERASISDYPDAEKVSPYAQEALEWCQAKGILVPRDGKIAAWSPATRVELAVMLSRYLKVVGK